MYLIQIMLPLYDNRGRRLPRQLFDQVSEDLVRAHGGVTANRRSPATDRWKTAGASIKRDETVVYEVMSATCSRTLWARRRKLWEAAFRQDSIFIRAMRFERL